MKKLLIALVMMGSVSFISTSCEDMNIEPEKEQNCCGNPQEDPDPDPDGDD